VILCKFTKADSAVYLPHLDLLREMGRAVRRANLSVRFSEGFNPHVLLFFSQPLPLGLASVAEYFCADSEEDPKKFMDGLNEKLPRGVRILGAVKCEKAEVHALTSHAAYRYKKSAVAPVQAQLDDIMSRITVEIPVKTKKGQTVADVKPRIHSLKEENGDIVAVLGCGKQNLRADSFGKFLAQTFCWGEDYDILKERAFVCADGSVKDVDAFYGLETE
jgi:radical SAM-linked protein